MEIPTKAYIDWLSENDRNRRDLFMVFIDQDNEFDNTKITKLDDITVDRNPLTDEKVSKENIDDELDKRTILRFN